MTPSSIAKSMSGWLSRLAASEVEAEAELLHRYATTGDQDAFAALTEWFAPLVWGVCSRALRNPQDAEDAFQATFLALAKQATGLTDRGPLGPWLHQVARRSAALVYRQNQRRREVPVNSTPAVPQPTDDRELAAALDEEIERLPEKYRRPVVLCYIQQQTYAEAAQSLGYSVPTVCRRVTQGCELLRKQLTRRGLAPTAGLAVLFAAVARPAFALPPGLVARTVRAVQSGGSTVAAGVAESALRSLGWSRAVFYTVGLSVAALVGAIAGLALPGTPPAEPSAVIETTKATTEPTGPRLDRLGDPLPAGAIARIGTLRMRGEGGAPGDVAFLPGGRAVASVHGRATVWVWDIETGKELHRLPGPPRSHLLAPSPDGRRLAVCGTNEVRLLSVENLGAVSVVWNWAPAKAEVAPRVIAAAFAPDGKTLAISDAAAGVVRLLDAATGRERQTLPGDAATELAFTPDGKTLGGLKNNYPTAGRIDGYRLVLWDTASGQPREVAAAAAGVLRRFVFVGGNVIVTDAHGDRQARVVDLKTGREVTHWPDRGMHSILAPTPDGTAVAELVGGKVTVRDPASGAVVRTTGAVRELSIVDRQADVFGWRFSGDGRFFAATTRGGQVWVWDVVAGKEAGPPGRIHGGVQSLAFSPDGNTVTTLHGSAGRSWETGSGTPAAPLSGGEGELAAHDIVFPDASGPTVIQFPTPADQSLRATAWSAATGAAVDRRPIPTDVWQTGAASGAVSPDGRWLAWGTPTVVSLINRATGQEARRLTPATKTTATLRFSADGQTLLRVPSGKDMAEAWDAETGVLRATLKLPPRNRSTTSLPVIGLSADGRWLAAVGKQPDATQALTLIEIDTAERYTLPTPAATLHALAFSPDGRRLAGGAEDGSVRVWDLALGKELSPFRGHRGRTLTVLFSPDGARIASGGFDGTGLVWDAPPPAEIKPTRGPSELWADLAGGDSAAAHRATFTAAPTMIPALAERLPTETGSPAARGVAVLERLGSPAAQDVLKQLATRGDGDTVGRGAAAALRRIARQKAE